MAGSVKSAALPKDRRCVHVGMLRQRSQKNQCWFCPAVSTGQRNTVVFLERWSVSHGVPEANILQRQAKCGDLGSLSAMHASPAGSGWQRGESMSSIGRHCDRASSSIYPLLERTGGIRPPVRRRSRLTLTLVDREEISRGLIANLSLRAIARSLRRPASTISREIKRNGGSKQYRAAASGLSAWSRAQRPKLCKLVGNDYLCGAISAKLKRKWSPQQIAGWLMREHRDEED
jgi:hypothetical protein